MHSREFYRMLAVMLALTGAAAIGQGLAWGVPGIVAALLLGGALTALAAVYTLRRYRRIAQLSEYLAQVYTGGQPPRLSGQTPGELSALQDDLYKITSILQQQASALKADKRFLADSLSDIAHQLRTPLSAILLQCDFLREELPPGEAVEGLAQIETQADRIRWLVESLLRLSRLDAGVVPFEKRKLPARQVIQRAAGWSGRAVSETECGATGGLPGTAELRLRSGMDRRGAGESVEKRRRAHPGRRHGTGGIQPAGAVFRIPGAEHRASHSAGGYAPFI